MRRLLELLVRERLEYPYGRLQWHWYGWRGPWRLLLEQEPIRIVYRWRVGIGPLDVRRWESVSGRNRKIDAIRAETLAAQVRH